MLTRVKVTAQILWGGDCGHEQDMHSLRPSALCLEEEAYSKLHNEQIHMGFPIVVNGIISLLESNI